MRRLPIGIGISVVVVVVGIVAGQRPLQGDRDVLARAPAPASVTARATQAAPAPVNALQQVDPAHWSTFITDEQSGGLPWNSVAPGESSMGSGGFNAQEFLANHVTASAAGVTITASPGASAPGLSWSAGVLSSYGHLSFDGGYLQVQARMPDTSAGAWPGLWLVPGPGDLQDDEIDLFEGGLTSYGDNVNDNFSGFVHTDGRLAGQTINTGVDLEGGLHTYAISWVPGRSVTWFLDGKQVEKVTSSQLRIPDQPMALVFDIQMATAAAASWHTVSSGSANYAMQIVDVEYSPNPRAAP